MYILYFIHFLNSDLNQIELFSEEHVFKSLRFYWVVLEQNHCSEHIKKTKNKA